MLSKMDINGTALRILTLACYFLPFVFFFSTCVDGVSKNAYNRTEAIANEKEKIAVEKKDILDRATDLITDNLSVTDSSAEMSSETIKILEHGDDGWYLTPTYTSLSAIGVVLTFENGFGQILIVASFLLALFTLLLWRFLKGKGIGVYFVGINLFIVLVFVVMCVALHITVLYGAWTLVFLLVVQLLSAIKDKRTKINTTLEGINPN